MNRNARCEKWIFMTMYTPTCLSNTGKNILTKSIPTINELFNATGVPSISTAPAAETSGAPVLPAAVIPATALLPLFGAATGDKGTLVLSLGGTAVMLGRGGTLDNLDDSSCEDCEDIGELLTILGGRGAFSDDEDGLLLLGVLKIRFFNIII